MYAISMAQRRRAREAERGTEAGASFAPFQARCGLAPAEQQCALCKHAPADIKLFSKGVNTAVYSSATQMTQSQRRAVLLVGSSTDGSTVTSSHRKKRMSLDFPRFTVDASAAVVALLAAIDQVESRARLPPLPL